MRKPLFLASAALAFLALCLLPGTAAEAQLIQTFVSYTGDDTNPCSRTSPCASWGGAFDKTAAGGEIVALDAGNFGTLGGLAITHAITLDGGAGQVAGAFGLSGTSITISAGASDVVTLRNLDLNGYGSTGFPGTNGILIDSAATVHIENCKIYGFTKNGIVAKTSTNTNLIINDTTISDNLNGIQLGPVGTVLLGSFERVRVHNNSNAGIFLNPGAGGDAVLALNRSTVTFNGTGLLVEPVGQAILDDTEFFGNINGAISVVGSGVVQSFGNNPIVSKTPNPAFTSTPLQ